MKARNIIALLALLCSFSVISLSAEFESCRCYCSVKCGPRDSQPGEKPFVATVNDKNGKSHKMCFCADRDLRLFAKNGCDGKGEVTCCQATQEADQESEESEEPIEE